MPPAVESIREQILADLVTTLGGINGGTTYFNTIKLATRDEKDVTEGDRTNWPVVVITQNEVSSQQNDDSFQTIFDQLSVRVTAFREVSKNFSLEAERLLHDLTKAVETDPRRGGATALATRITEKHQEWDEASSFLEVQLLLQIDFRRDRAKP